MLWFCTIILLLLLPAAAHGQVLEGTTIDRESSATVAGITVVNLHTGIVTFSDQDGHYAIQASPGDTIQFRHTAYQQVEEVMTFTLGTKFKSILLQPSIYKLKEATILGLTKYQQDSIELHELYHHELTKTLVAPPKYTGLGCAGCIGWLADKITGNSKKPKAFRKHFATEDQNKFIDTRYTFDLVSSLTGIRDTDSMAIFVYTYPMEYDFARTATELELKAWIRNNYKQYMKKP